LFRKLLLMAPFSINPCCAFPVDVFSLNRFPCELLFTTKPKKLPVAVTCFTSEEVTPSKSMPLPKLLITPGPLISTIVLAVTEIPAVPSEPPPGPVMVWPFKLRSTLLAPIVIHVLEMGRSS